MKWLLLAVLGLFPAVLGLNLRDILPRRTIVGRISDALSDASSRQRSPGSSHVALGTCSNLMEIFEPSLSQQYIKIWNELSAAVQKDSESPEPRFSNVTHQDLNVDLLGQPVDDALHTNVDIEVCLSKLPEKARRPALARVLQAQIDDSPLWRNFSMGSAMTWAEFVLPGDDAINLAAFPASHSQADKDAEQDRRIDQLLEELRRQKELSEKREQYWQDRDRNQTEALDYLTGERCGLPKVSSASWNSSGAAQVLEEEVTRWKDSGREHGDFTRWFFQEYASRLSRDREICNGRQSCSVASCTDLDFLKVPKDKRAAYYYILDGMGKTNRMFIEVNNAIAEAVDSVMLDVNHIFVAHTPKILHESHKLPASMVTSWTSMVVGSLIPAFCSIGGTGTGVAVGFVSGLIHSAINTAANSGDPNKPIADIMIPLDQFATFLKKAVEVLRDVVHGFAADVFTGTERDGATLLITVLNERSWIYNKLNNEDFTLMRQRFKERLEGGMINHAWRSQYVFISRSRAKGDSCYGDDRGHPALKVCLPDLAPGEVFYASYVDWEKSHGSKDRMMPPPGFTDMRYGLTLEDVVRASFAWDQQFGRQDFDKVPSKDVELLSNAGGNKLDAVMNIPIWPCPDGHCISRVNDQGHVNPPCLAGDFGWNKDDVVAARRENRDLTYELLVATGLFAHPSWLHLCRNRHKANCKHVHPRKDMIFKREANIRIQASEKTLHNYWYYHEHPSSYPPLDPSLRRDMLQNGVMHIPEFLECKGWQKHAWGWIPEVDEKGIDRGTKAWMDRWHEHFVERKRDLNFKGWTWWKKRSLLTSSLANSTSDNAVADLEDDQGVRPARNMDDTPVYERLSDFVLDNKWVLEDSSFDWSDWQMAALARGYNVTDNAEK